MSRSAMALGVCCCLLLAGSATGADGSNEFTGSAAEGSDGFTGRSGLAGYLLAAESLSPSIRGARAGREAALAGAGRVGWLPDPTVSYGHYFEEIETRVGPQTRRVGVRQKLPWFGKLSVARDAAGVRAASRSRGSRGATTRLTSL